MSAVVDADIVKNQSPTYKFQFRALAPLDNTKQQPATAIPLVNQESKNNILFRFVGQTEDLFFTFALFDDGTRVDDSTALAEDFPTGVITIDEQIEFLRDFVFSAGFDDTWTITQSRYYPGGISGVITSIKFNQKAGAGTVVTGSFVFKLGKIGLLGGD